MEGTIQSIADYTGRLLVERWLELIIIAIIVGVWRWLIGHNLRKKIRKGVRKEIGALKSQRRVPETIRPQEAETIVHLQPGAVFNDFRASGGEFHVQFDGTGEVVSPHPIRVFHSEALAVADQVEAVLTKADNDLIPLSDALVRAWDMKEVRELPEFETLVRERPRALYRRLAERIFDGGDPRLSIRGVTGNPPLERTVEPMEEYGFSDDLTEMIHLFDENRRYRDLHVMWPDIEASLRQRTVPSTEGEDNGRNQ